MALILFDTSIFLDMLGGCDQASVELNSYDVSDAEHSSDAIGGR